MELTSKGNLPKKGMLRPTINVDTTNAVRMRIEYIYDLEWLDGISSSRLIATGDMVSAYVFEVKEENVRLFDGFFFFRSLVDGKLIVLVLHR